MNIVEKYKEQLEILEDAQRSALNDRNHTGVRELSTAIYQLCNAICIEEGTPLNLKPTNEPNGSFIMLK